MLPATAWPWRFGQMVFIDAIRRSVSAWNHVLGTRIVLFYVHLTQALDDNVGAVLT